MKLFPAIDLYQGSAVRLYKGDYDQMTVYSRTPCKVAAFFEEKGASCLHLVDLEGARSGDTLNLPAVKEILSKTRLYTELGGGIRSLNTIDKYLSIGVNRVILGTAAITEPGFVASAVKAFGPEAIAVGVDIKDGKAAIKGWTEVTDISCDDFCLQMEKLGVKTVICTDISRDGAMKGTNRSLYEHLSRKFKLDIIASGGVSNLRDIEALAAMKISGAILGKALYTGAVDLGEALLAASREEEASSRS